MACQSGLERIEVRVDGGGPEEIHTRMALADYFSTLGVPALLGRAFSVDDDPAASNAVISYAYWQRRFGRRADILGTKMSIRQGVFSIVGVAPPSFFGETVGQRPDVWLPLTMQPAVLPGRDWLHDKLGEVEKVMWLHAFGRLKPASPPRRRKPPSTLSFNRDWSPITAPC